VSGFSVQCAIGDDQICIEVPTDGSVGDVLRVASDATGKKCMSIWNADWRMDCQELFADYFEPEATYLIKLEHDCVGGLMLVSGEKLESFGIDLASGKLLMDVNGPFDMQEFVAKVEKPEAKPTILLVEWKQGVVVGGFAAVPWPSNEGMWRNAEDPEVKSFIISLEPNARRFDLRLPAVALGCDTFMGRRSFQFGSDLLVFDDGTCGAKSCVYDCGRGDGSFPSRNGIPFVRFELWSL
jgi:hypothetical protein